MPSPDARYRYSAFISYNQNETDKRAATAVQLVIESLGKPWYKWRVSRVYRDTTNLEAKPDLWAELKRQIDSCEYFLVIASEGSGIKSDWVHAELCYWLTGIDIKADEKSNLRTGEDINNSVINEKIDRTFIIHTERDWEWLKRKEVRTTFRVLLDKLREKGPFIGELRALNADEDSRDPTNRKFLEKLDPANPSFVEKIGPILSTVRHLNDTEGGLAQLVREDYKQHRTKLTIFRGLAAGLLVFLVMAFFAARYAKQQSDQARRNRARVALENARVAADEKRASHAALWYLEALEQLPCHDPLYDSADRLTRHWLEQVGHKIVHDSTITCHAFSLDGKLLATGDDSGLAMLWRVDEGLTLVGAPIRNQTRVTAVAFHPDGKSWIVCCDQRNGSTVTGTIVRSISIGDWRSSAPKGIDGEGLVDARFSPNGQWLLLRDRNRFTPLISGSLRDSPFNLGVEQKEGEAFIGFTSDDAYLVSCLSRELRIHRSDHETLSWSFPAQIKDGKMCRDDKVVLLMDDGTGQVQSIKSRESTRSFRWSSDGMDEPVWGTNGNVVGVWRDSAILLWDVSLDASASPTEPMTRIPLEPKSRPDMIAISRDGDLIAASWGEAICLYETIMGTLVGELPDRTGKIEAIEFAPTSGPCMLLTRVAKNDGVQLWHVPMADSRFEPKKSLKSRSGVTAMCLSSCQRRVVTANYDGSLQIRSAQSLEPIFELPTRGDPAEVNLSHDDSVLFVKWLDRTSSSSEIVAYQNTRGQPIIEWKTANEVDPHPIHRISSGGSQCRMAPTSNGGLLLIEKCGRATRWDRIRGEATRQTEFKCSALAPRLYVKSLAANPVAREFVAISQDSQELVKYDLDSGKQVAVCPSEFNSAVYSPDGGELVLFGTDTSSPGPALRRVDAKTMKPVGDDVTWSSPFLTVAINRSRDVLLSGGRYGELVLWDYRTMHRLSTPFYQASRDGAKWSRINATSIDAGGTNAIAGTTRDFSYGSGQIAQAQREIRRWQIRKSGTPSSQLRESVEGRTGMRLELVTGRITGLTLEQWMGRMANTRPPVGHVAPTMPSSAK